MTGYLLRLFTRQRSCRHCSRK